MASRSRSRSPGHFDVERRSRSRSPTPRRDRSPTPRSVRDYSREPSPVLRDASLDRDRGRSPPRRNGGGRRSISPSGRGRSYSRSRSRSRSRSPTRSPSPVQPVRSTKIVVERLTKNINENHLREIFGQFGEIEDLDLPLNRTCTLSLFQSPFTSSP